MSPATPTGIPLTPFHLAAAQRHGVVPDIHPEDFIFQFLLGHSSFPSPQSAVEHYFDDGATSAHKLQALLQELGGFTQGARLLEFASGYGCVTRHFARVLPAVRVTSCDIHTSAIEFIEHKLGVPAVLSHAVPEKLFTHDPYDVIFVLSFFSHMPRRTWSRWLARLLAMVSPGGVLLFTTHGLESRRFFNAHALDDEGFWFQATSEQRDLDTGEYGSTIVTPTFVFRQAAGLQPMGRLVLFREAAWWGHQDLYVMRRHHSR